MVCFSEHYMKSQHLCYAGGQARPFSTGLSVSKSPTAALELKESPPTGQFQPGAAVLEAHTKGLPVRSVDFTRGTDNITVRQGDTAILRCYVEDRSSKVAWLNRSGIIFAGEDKWSLDPRVELEKRNPLEYSLRIQKVDVYDEGSYTCSVQTQHHPKTSQVYLIVQVPPKISNISSDITVNEGSNVTLVCMANGRPEPVITWRHLTPTGREFEGEEEYLEILGITREQSGKYECKAANEVASADVKQVRVTVNYPPTITESKSNEAATGRQALLRCEASAVPTPDFEWYRDDTRINSANGLEIKSTGSQSLLMVANVTEEHYGNYTCVAANKLGVTNASLYLYRPGTGRVDNGSMSLAVPLWLLAASLLCLLSKC
ncbi:limbic system-associated membrane protein isoform 2-T2 [Cyanocitta cristata]